MRPNPDSPHYLFEPDSLGWLHRKHAKNEPIYKADIVRLLEADAENATDRVLQTYMLPALTGKLNPPRGRPGGRLSRWSTILIAACLINSWAKDIRAERGGVRTRGAKGPKLQAADEVARYMDLNVTGEALLNAISACKNGRIAMTY